MSEILVSAIAFAALIISVVALSTWRMQFNHDLIHKLMTGILTLDWHVRSLEHRLEGDLAAELAAMEFRWRETLTALSAVQLSLIPCRAKWGREIADDVAPLFEVFEKDLRCGVESRIKNLREDTQRGDVFAAIAHSVNEDYVNLIGPQRFEDVVEKLRGKYLERWYHAFLPKGKVEVCTAWVAGAATAAAVASPFI